MSKLKLSTVPDDTPVKLTIELPAARVDAFAALVRDLTRGRGRVTTLVAAD